MHATLTQVIIFYALLIIILAAIGYHTLNKKGEGTKGLLIGAGVGVAISAALWFAVGKKAVHGGGY